MTTFWHSQSKLLGILIGVYIEETRIERDTCTPMFIAALFTTARTKKQPRCPSADKWIRKLWYIYTMEYYSAIKKNAFESVLMRWMKLEPIIEWSQSERKTPIQYINAYIWNLERWYWWTYLQGGNRDRDIRTDLWTWGEETGEQIERVVLKQKHYHMLN